MSPNHSKFAAQASSSLRQPHTPAHPHPRPPGYPPFVKCGFFWGQHTDVTTISAIATPPWSPLRDAAVSAVTYIRRPVDLILSEFFYAKYLEPKQPHMMCARCFLSRTHTLRFLITRIQPLPTLYVNLPERSAAHHSASHLLLVHHPRPRFRQRAH